MSKKSGSAGSPVSPAAPDAAEDADIADPGKMAEIKAEQLEKKKGKYGSEQVKPHKPPETQEEEEQKTSWIEIKLVDEEENPVPGEQYRVELPDDLVAEGTLDEKGFVHIDGIEPGMCNIKFPNLIKESRDDN